MFLNTCAAWARVWAAGWPVGEGVYGRCPLSRQIALGVFSGYRSRSCLTGWGIGAIVTITLLPARGTFQELVIPQALSITVIVAVPCLVRGVSG